MTPTQKVARQKVARLAAKVEAYRLDRDWAIREARAAGLPLRVVAEAAGVSYETVRRIAG